MTSNISKTNLQETIPVDLASHEMAVLENVIANHDTALYQQIDSTPTGKRYTQAIYHLSECSPFFTLVFSLHDDEISHQTKNTLSLRLQQALYSAEMEQFVRYIHQLCNQSMDDYEHGYYLTILKAAGAFIQTDIYQEFKQAKHAFDEDKSPACFQLKTSIEHLRTEVKKLISTPYHSHFNSEVAG